MNNLEKTQPPKFLKKSTKNAILAIVFGIVALLLMVLAHSFWPLYFFVLGFSILSFLESLKYFELTKLGIVALNVSVCVAIIFVYNVLGGINEFIKGLFTFQSSYYYESHYPNYDDFGVFEYNDKDDGFWD